jgi:hypothetical protein
MTNIINTKVQDISVTIINLQPTVFTQSKLKHNLRYIFLKTEHCEAWSSYIQENTDEEILFCVLP